MKQNRIYTISVCLSDIPPHKIVTAGKQTKMYCEMVVADKKEQDQYGYDAKVYCKQSEEERKATDAKKDYVGRGKATLFTDDGKVDDAAMLRNRIYTINVCLSDIPNDAVKVWEKDGPAKGKAYVDLCVADKKEADKYGFDVSVYVRQTKEQRERNENRVYCGRGKMDVFGGGGIAMTSNPWAVGGAQTGGHEGPEDYSHEQSNTGSQYEGSGFNNGGGGFFGGSSANNSNGNGGTFFGGEITKDDLPF